jgi:large subunit ribosomal protein L15
MPLYRRLPKRGFNNIFKDDFVVSLGRIQAASMPSKLDRQADDRCRRPQGCWRYPSHQGRRSRPRRWRTEGQGHARSGRRFQAAVEKIEKAGGSVKLLSAAAE